MSFPDPSDLLRFALGVNVPLPIPTFGHFVALAVALARSRGFGEHPRSLAFGRLPAGSDRLAADVTTISLPAGIAGARVFDVLDRLPQFAADTAPLMFSRSGRFSVASPLLSLQVYGF